MKKYVWITLLLLWGISVSAQNTLNCTQPVADYVFQQKKRDIANQPVEAQKLIIAKQLLSESCLYASQVKELADIFLDDYSRLEFAKSAYLRTLDKHNFYDVYNAFGLFSSAFMLHDYVLEMRNTISNPTQNLIGQLSFPALAYPNYNGYNGMQKCNFPVAENEFYQQAINVNTQQNEQAKIIKLDQVIFNYCLSTSQAMKLATLLSIEANRLNFLKKAYQKIYDVGNFQQAVQVFSQLANQENLLSFINTQNGNPNNNPNFPCAVTQAEFNDVKNRVKKEAFNNVKLNTAKTLIRSKKCFTSQQLKELVMLFTFSDTKMDLAKFGYDFATDKDNYYVVMDAFTFASDKESFMKFLESKR